MSLLNRIEFGSKLDNVAIVQAVVDGFGDAYYDPLPHASAQWDGELCLAVPFVVERVNERLAEPLSAVEVVKLLTLFGFEVTSLDVSAIKVLVWNDKIMNDLLEELMALDGDGSVVAKLAMGKVVVNQWPPRYLALAQMPLSDEQRAYVAEWLDYQLALFREYLLNG